MTSTGRRVRGRVRFASCLTPASFLAVLVCSLCLLSLHSLLSRLDCCSRLISESSGLSTHRTRMSDAQPSAPDAAAASARAPPKKRPRHFWDGPDPPDDSDDEEKQGASHVSPVARLYRHALESVFGFLKLADLSRVLAVSRSWSAAVRTMKSIDADVSSEGVVAWMIAASGLAVHVKHFGSKSNPREVSSDALFILSHPPISLISLACEVALSPPSSRLLFGASLRSVTLRLEGDANSASATNDVIVTVGRLPVLEELSLCLPFFFPEVSFVPLVAAPRLQELSCWNSNHVQPSHAQLDQLRMLPHLRAMKVPFVGGGALIHLLRTPHSLHWQQVHQLHHIDNDAASALSTLPTLTRLDTYECRSVTFLPALHRLRTLWLSMDFAVRLAADIVTGLFSCSQLTELRLLSAVDVTSQHLWQALSHLPALCSLELWHCSALTSLSFISECAGLSQSLHSFGLNHCGSPDLHSTELKHVLTLKALKDLKVRSSFVEPLDALTQHLFTPPSVLPTLVQFTYSRDY